MTISWPKKICGEPKPEKQDLPIVINSKWIVEQK
jgi:hypothetical protein